MTAASSRRTTKNTPEHKIEEDNVENITTTTTNTDNVSDNVTESDKVEEEVTVPVNRIPDALTANPILEDFAKQYLAILDKIVTYNKDVLAEKDSEWNSFKVLEKAREMGRPTDKNVEADKAIADALTKWESLVAEVNLAKRSVIELTSKELGITLSATNERNPEIEAPLKVERNRAVEIGKQLAMLGSMTTDKNATAVIEEFLGKNGLPAIGRDQVKVFGSDSEKSTPKYRVNVVVKNADGEELVNEAGFTKAGLTVAKYYERGAGIKPEKMREAWEAAGNDGTKVVSPVQFVDNGLTFTITKK